MIARSTVLALAFAALAGAALAQAPAGADPRPLSMRLEDLKTSVAMLDAACGASCISEALVLTAGEGEACLDNVLPVRLQLPDGVRWGMLTWVDAVDPASGQAAQVPVALVQPAASSGPGVAKLCLPPQGAGAGWASGLRLGFPSDAVLGALSRAATRGADDPRARLAGMTAGFGGMRVFAPDSIGWMKALITSDPPGAVVILDGAPVGVQTNGVLRLAPGALGRLRLRSPAAEIPVRQCEQRIRPSLELDVQVVCRFTHPPLR